MSDQEFRLTEGAKAPSFSLLDQNGQQFSSEKLAGQKAILYFTRQPGHRAALKKLQISKIAFPNSRPQATR